MTKWSFAWLSLLWYSVITFNNNHNMLVHPLLWLLPPLGISSDISTLLHKWEICFGILDSSHRNLKFKAKWLGAEENPTFWKIHYFYSSQKMHTIRAMKSIISMFYFLLLEWGNSVQKNGKSECWWPWIDKVLQQTWSNSALCLVFKLVNYSGLPTI